MTDLRIATSRFYHPEVRGSRVKDGLLLVSIARGLPRHLPKTFPAFDPLMPTRPLLSRYQKGGMEWKEYADAYLGRLNRKFNGPAVVDTLAAMAADQDCEGVVLLCHCDLAKSRCHRTLAAGWVHQETGCWAEELPMPEPPQRRLL